MKNKQALREVIETVNNDKKVTIDASVYTLDEIKEILQRVDQRDVTITLVNCIVIPHVEQKELADAANSSLANVVVKY